MTKKHIPILLQFFASALLAGIFLVPIWQITLEAAQFPEGLKLYIWINDLTGSSEYIIQNINILNHYIGMKEIEKGAIKEFRSFPIIISVLIVLGIITAVVNRSRFYLYFFILLLLVAGIGFYDFYLWLYDFGHNLDPEAPIKVPGMTYMPPLIGEKDLLNFRAKSYPHFGTLFYGFSMILAITAYRFRKKENEKN